MLATVRTRSRPFAQTNCLQRLRVGRANGSEPERTPSAAIAAIVIVATSNSPGPAGSITHQALRTREWRNANSVHIYRARVLGPISSALAGQWQVGRSFKAAADFGQTSATAYRLVELRALRGRG
jgi:hypothetical protein